MPRPQFTLRALLVAMLVVGAFFAGAKWQERRTSEAMAEKDGMIEDYRWEVGRLTGKIPRGSRRCGTAGTP